MLTNTDENSHTRNMRPDAIKLIKDRILGNPDFKMAVNELKANLVSYGVTEEELNEAIRQLTGLALPSVPPVDKKDLDKTKQELETTKTAVDNTAKELITTKTVLEKELNTTNDELTSTKQELHATQQTLEKELQKTQKEITQNMQEMKKEFEKKRQAPVAPTISNASPFQVTKDPNALHKLFVVNVATQAAMIVLVMLAGIIFSTWFLVSKYITIDTPSASTISIQKIFKVEALHLVEDLDMNFKH